ncbi:MAG TPA: Omp28-related outer membrane protein [bacterium]|jgi:uncharacterized repeat protein (TIGR01451 family)
MNRRSFVVMLAIAALLLLGALTATAAVRTVLTEGFTQWNCGPCAGWNPIERQVVEAMGRDSVLNIKYHVSWPAPNNDAMYLWNTSEVNTKITYYNVTGVPDGWVDGRTEITRSASGFRSQIRTARNVPAPCTIDIEASISGETTVQFSGTVTATDSALANTRLYVVLISDVDSPSPHGSNGETSFDNIFRDFYPDAAGQTITSVPLNGTLDFSGTLNKSAAWDTDSMSVVVFLQDYASKYVHQAAWAPVLNLWQVQTSCTDPVQLISEVNGGEVDYTIQLSNHGRNNDTYTVSVGDALPGGWTQTIEATDVASDPTSIDVPLTSGEATTLTLRVNPNGHGGSANLAVNIQSQGNTTTTAALAFRLMAGLDVLLVDDDGGANNVETFYTNALQASEPNRACGWWDLHAGALDENILPAIPMLIWMTGASPTGNTLTAAEQSTLEMYVNNGGKLFLTGQGIAFDLRTSSFMTDVLHVGHYLPFPTGHNVTGVSGNAISDGLDLAVIGGDGASNQTRQNKIHALDSYATPIWNWQGVTGDTCAAVQVETPVYKLVFMAFGFEAISSAANRNAVMGRIVDWMLGPVAADPRTVSAPNEFALAQNYPNPFNPETVIPYALPLRAEVSLRIFDVLGRQVAVLASGLQEPGAHAVTWNAAKVSSGLYFYSLEAKAGSQTFRATRKLMLLK